MILSLASCKTPSRARINATIWLSNIPLPKEVCDRSPELRDRGFYRRLDNGKFEFVSFCSPVAKEWVSIPKKDFLKLLDEYVPKDSAQLNSLDLQWSESAHREDSDISE